MTASQIFSKYGDKNGFISRADLELTGWTVAQAEEEGLIIKEKVYIERRD